MDSRNWIAKELTNGYGIIRLPPFPPRSHRSCTSLDLSLFVSFIDEHLQRHPPNSRDILNQVQLHV